MLANRVIEDGLQAIPYLADIVDQYDPTSEKRASREKNARAFAAEDLISQIDERRVRVRASGDGRVAIDVIERLVTRMRQAHFDTATGKKYDDRLRYLGTVSALQGLQGASFLDDAIRATLKLRYGVRLSEDEFANFISFMLAKKPDYPSLARTSHYKDFDDLNEAGLPAIRIVVTDPAPFHELYLQYCASLPALVRSS